MARYAIKFTLPGGQETMYAGLTGGGAYGLDAGLFS